MKRTLIFFRLGCLIGLACVCSLIASGQKNTTKFGKPVLEELQMTSYALDSSAHAVVLYDEGFLGGSTALFTRHVRIKVLKSAGTSYANFSVRTPARSDINGYTYNLVNGEIVTTELARENIFREEIVDGLEIYKIFFPQVKPGSVVDLRYSFYGLPSEWRFQELIPTVYSELTIPPSSGLIFKRIPYGFEKIEALNDYQWVARNVPALSREPYMNDYSNYLTKFKFDIEKVMIRGVAFEFSTSWEMVSEKLIEHPYFGGVMRASAFLNDKAEEIRKSNGSTTEKIAAAVAYIKENMKWNNSSRLFASIGFRDKFKNDHVGSSADINLILISLLQKAGVNTYPLVLSTRDNGLVNPASASLSSLNFVVAFVKHEGLEMFVDATDPNGVPGVLPANCRNISGWAITTKNGGQWLDLSGGKANSRKQFVSIEQLKDGDFQASVSTTYEDYDFLEWMEEYKNFSGPEAYASAVGKKSDLEVRSCAVVVDPLKLKATKRSTVSLAGSSHIQDLGDEIVINPFVESDFKNPFQSETRHYPVDFIYPMNRSIISVIKIPDNYTLRSLPETIVLVPETGGAKFTFRASVANNVLSIKCDFQIERQIFSESEYLVLRNFFTNVFKKINEPIQIDKKT